MPPVEKKIVTMSVRMPRELDRRICALAAAKGLTPSQLVRNALVALIEEERRYHLSLSAIFAEDGEGNQLNQCVTVYDMLDG